LSPIVRSTRAIPCIEQLASRRCSSVTASRSWPGHPPRSLRWPPPA